jgi:hypothetical protein
MELQKAVSRRNEAGRWPARDPLGENGGINLYAMVGNDPAGFVDLWGLKQITINFGITEGLTVSQDDIDKLVGGLNTLINKCESKYPGKFQKNLPCIAKGIIVANNIANKSQTERDVDDPGNLINNIPDITPGIPVVVAPESSMKYPGGEIQLGSGFPPREGNPGGIFLNGSHLNTTTLGHEIGHYGSYRAPEGQQWVEYLKDTDGFLTGERHDVFSHNIHPAHIMHPYGNKTRTEVDEPYCCALLNQCK